MKKLMFLLLALAFIAAPAFAGNRPEYDAVGLDSDNVFNDAVKDFLDLNNIDTFGVQIELFSDFRPFPTFSPNEFFRTTAGVLAPDPCFFFLADAVHPVTGYLSALTDAYNQGTYEWQIVLQMKPETDLNINITDCVLKHNEFDILSAADQTGRYRAPWGQLIFVPTANPSIFAKTLPGRFATFGHPAGGFILDARTIPLLRLIPLNNVLYTTKAFWTEGIVVKLPETGVVNSSGQTEYNLKQADAIYVRVTIPYNNTVDVRYGPDNVVIKYVGIIGTEFETLHAN